MNKRTIFEDFSRVYSKPILVLLTVLGFTLTSIAQVILESEVKITDLGLHFNGSKVTSSAPNTG